MARFKNYSDQTGYLGADPESRNVHDSKVVTFQLATTKRWKDKDSGELKESTFWRRYEAWGPQGENILKILKKGAHVRVISEPRNDEFEKDGQKHYVEVHRVQEWYALDSKDDDSGAADE